MRKNIASIWDWFRGTNYEIDTLKKRRGRVLCLKIDQGIILLFWEGVSGLCNSLVGCFSGLWGVQIQVSFSACGDLSALHLHTETLIIMHTLVSSLQP